MNYKDIVLIAIIFLATFTILKVENQKECEQQVSVKKKIERPFILEMYE